MSLPMGRITSGETTTNPLRDLRCLNGHGNVDSGADSGSGSSSFFKNNSGQDFASSADADKVTGNPGGWREVLDPESGGTYFYNDITEESAWEAPAGYAPPADEAPVRTRGLSVVEKKQLSAHSPRALRGKREANADSGFEGGIELGEVGGRQALHAEGETKSE